MYKVVAKTIIVFGKGIVQMCVLGRLVYSRLVRSLYGELVK